jgi:hypothetical protein
MKLTDTTAPGVAFLAVVFACGSPGGAALIVLSWWLLTMVVDPIMADEWWEYALVAAYLLGPIWAPLLAGFAVLRLAQRLGWIERRGAYRRGL